MSPVRHLLLLLLLLLRESLSKLPDCITLHYITSFHSPITPTVINGAKQSHSSSPNASLKG